MGCLQETCDTAEDPTVPSCGCQDVAASPQKTACSTAVWRASYLDNCIWQKTDQRAIELNWHALMQNQIENDNYSAA